MSMRKQMIRVATLLAAIGLISAAGAVAKPEVFEVGNLFLRDNGGIAPTTLPKHGQAPVSAHFVDQIGTDDGSHPPAFESLIADFDKGIHVNAKGLPVCAKSQLVARTTAAAEKACPGALVGSGHAAVEVAFSEQTPFTATGSVLLFNGGVHGATTVLYIHSYISVPAPTAVVATAMVTRIHDGHYGLHVVAQIPPIAGGAGSVTKFKLTIDRKFPYKGKQQSYLTAGCATGSYYAEGKVRFSDATLLHVTHIFPCTPKG